MGKRKRYILKTIAWILLALVIVFLAMGTFVFYNAEKYINKNLSEFISQKSNGLYTLSFEKIDIEFKPLSFSISEISFSPDKNESDRVLQKTPDKVLYEFHSPEIKLIDIKLITLLREKSFQCKNITFVEPEIHFSGAEVLQIDTTKTFDKLFVEIQPLFKKYLKNVFVEEISFVNANYKIYSSPVDFNQISNAQNISVIIKQFQTDSTLIFNESRFFESEDILVQMNNFKNDLGDSLHILTIDTLAYSLKTSDIFANGFHLFHKIKNSTKNLYDVKVPELHIKSKSITRFSLSDSLDVQFLEFRNPTIKFYQKENPKVFDIDEINQFNLYSLVQQQFTELKIDSFIILNGNLEIYKQANTENYQQQFESLNISLLGFYLDSTSVKNTLQLFHSDNIEMQVDGYHLQLEDNLHEFVADSMFISTLTNSVGTKNIKISPLKNQENKSRTEVNVECAELFIDRVNLKELYHTRKLPTRAIRISKPIVKIQYHTEIKQNKEQKETGLLFNLVSDYLKGVYSEVVLLEKGKLNIENLYMNKVLGYFQTDFNFELTGFALDSTSIEQTDKFFYANNFDIQFTDYTMKLVDDLHKINVDQISILSADKQLEINNLRMEPIVKEINLTVMQKFNRSELYRIYIPKIILSNISLRDAFFYNKLEMANFKITNPEIYFENYGTLRQKKDKAEIADFYQLIFSYISDFNIGNIEIPNGKLTWINHTKKGKTTSFDNEFSATLQNFKLNEDEIKKQRLLFSDNFDISVKDQVFQLSDSVHVLQAGEINFSTSKSSVSIKNAALYPEIESANYSDLTTTFQVSIPELQITDINFLKAFYSKELLLNKLEINSPKFRIYNKMGVRKSLDLNKFQFPLPSLVQSLQLNELKINDGQVITYETEGLKHSAHSNFNIDLQLTAIKIKNNDINKAIISTNNVITSISDFKTPLGKKHELKIGQLDFNREQKSVSISQLKVIPFTQQNKGKLFSISAPQLNFTGFDIQAAIDKNHYLFDEITITNPDIDIQINDSIKGDKLEFSKTLNLFPFIEPYVDNVEVNKLELQKVYLNFNWFDKQLINRRFNLNFKEIEINENHKAENLLHSKEFEISTTNLIHKSKNGLYEFTADSLIYNSEKHNTLLKNIAINPLLSSDEFGKRSIFQTDFVKLKTDFIELKELDENLWFQKNILDAKALVIGKTNLDIFRNKRFPFNKNQRPPWPQDLIREIKQAFVFDSIFLKPSILKYSELMDITDEPGTIEFYDLRLKSGRLSNIEKYLINHSDLEIKASTKIMNQALLSIDFNFNLASKNYEHSLVGSLHPMQFRSFNPIIENSAPLSIESGQINRFDFNLKLDDKIAHGEIYFGYDNFKINVLDLSKTETKKSKLASFWANKMVLNSKNPKGDVLLPETISYERDIQRSIINYWWKAIFTGSKQSMGIKEKK